VHVAADPFLQPEDLDAPAMGATVAATLVFLLFTAGWTSALAQQPIRIGVLSHRGEQQTLDTWAPTAHYLTEQIPDYLFVIHPLDFNAVNVAVENAEVDFVLVNPGIYVNLEFHYRVSRIATLNNRLGDTSYNVFGGVIFSRSDHRDLQSLADLRGKSFMAVDAASLGGFQMAWGELKDQGLDPYRDLARLSFGGIHDRVVTAVRDGVVDAGTVRSGILELLAQEGTIDLAQLRIIAPRSEPDFPLSLSTPLYPEWPFSKVRHTSNQLAQQVAVALLQMPQDHPAALQGGYAGWTVPLDYQPVHDLFRKLRLPPYRDLGKFTLWDAIAKYWPWLLLALGALLVLAVLTTWVFRLNRALKRAKLNLETQHHLILDSVADGIFGVDLEGRATFVNRAMETITGWPAAELIGQNQHDVLHHTRADGSPHPPGECPVYATFRDNRALYVAEDTFWKKNGTSILVEYSSTPICGERGSIIGSVVVFRDITERKQAEEEARQHQLELAHVGRLSTMGEMASGIAHELNQPLTAIAANSHACIRMLESGAAQREQCADIMERIAAQAERAGEIIRQIRGFVRKEEPQRRPTDINSLIREVSVLFEPEARRAGVTVQMKLQRPIPQVLVQPIQIEQVILNLVRNAIEAMLDTPKGERMLIIATQPTSAGAALEVSVRDTGPGLDEALMRKIFDPFVTTKPQGIGLGLSISLGIIEAHNGHLHVDSAPNQGAVFRFILPARPGVTAQV
jgi:two-component system sensor histidine kinase TtrS